MSQSPAFQGEAKDSVVSAGMKKTKDEHGDLDVESLRNGE
jgi:hypothetical protein